MSAGASAKARTPGQGLMGDLFMFHDREALVPLLEDLRFLGAKEYTAWAQLLQRALGSFGQRQGELHGNKIQLINKHLIYLFIDICI